MSDFAGAHDVDYMINRQFGLLRDEIAELRRLYRIFSSSNYMPMTENDFYIMVCAWQGCRNSYTDSPWDGFEEKLYKQWDAVVDERKRNETTDIPRKKRRFPAWIFSR